LERKLGGGKEGGVDDGDGKIDFFIPSRLDEMGKVISGWEHLF
jgi:hypothetical protein